MDLADDEPRSEPALKLGTLFAEKYRIVRVLGSGSSAVLSAPQLKVIGAVHGVSTAQVALRWLAQHGVPSVTAASASEASYMKEDLNIFNWTLSAAEMAALLYTQRRIDAKRAVANILRADPVLANAINISFSSAVS